jgi:branched-chain amino acid transport system permease protein
LRSDYLALVMLVVSQIAVNVVQNETGLFNGPAGLSLVPEPLSSTLKLSPITYQWFYVGLTALICLIVYAFVHRITGSPLGRALRALRDNEQAALACGKNVFALRMLSFMIGGAIAAISGAVLVEFIGTWAPGAWLYPETFVLLAAVVVGGSGNNLGVVVGALLVPVAFLEATRFLPTIPDHPGLIDAFQWITTALLMMVFLWFRPQGIFPERRRRFPRPGQRGYAPAVPERVMSD